MAKFMALCLLMGILFAASVPCRADDGPIFNESEDSDFVHQLAHFGAGTIAAIPPDFILTRFPKDSWEHAWYTRLAIDCVFSAVVTDIYEAQTNKDLSTRIEHDADGALGAAVLVGASVSWTFQ